MDCFSNEGFDTKRFEEFARQFLSLFREMGCEENGHLKNEKAKIVSILANTAILCAH